MSLGEVMVRPAGIRRLSPLAVAWATPLRRAFVVTVVWRILIGVWGVVAHGLVRNGPTAGQTLTHHGWAADPWTYMVDAGVRQDGWWYARIAQHGYAFSTSHLSSIVFYPLFPALIKVVSLLTGSVYVAGMILSTAALFVAVWALSVWLERMGAAASAPLTVALMLCYPFGFFWASMYGEGIFLALALATFLAFERRAYNVAALAAFLAVLCRPTGLILAPCLVAAIVVPLWKARSASPAASSRVSPPYPAAAWLPVVAGPLAFAGFSAYQWLAFGTPFASIRAEAVSPFSRSFSQAISDLMFRRHGFPPWFLAFMLGIALLFLVAVPFVYRRFGLPYALFAALVVLFPLTSGLTSMERYVMVDFPAFAVLAGTRLRIIPVTICVIGCYMLLGFMTLFVGGYTLI